MLHCLKYFAAQSVNKEFFPFFFFQKTQKLIREGEGGRLNKSGKGVKNKCGAGGGVVVFIWDVEYMA